jgi:hypothetical protein
MRRDGEEGGMERRGQGRAWERGREERQGEGKGIKAIWDEEYSNHCRDVCCEKESVEEVKG